ncbi:MAG: hypothetical protein ABI091_27450 [Ferruginibacter sp.]
MYTLRCTDVMKAQLVEYNRISTNVGTIICELLINPFTNAVETNHPRLPQYYVDAGRYTIAFDVLDSEISIKHICNSVDFTRALNRPTGV